MTAIGATLASDQPSWLGRLGQALEHAITLRYPPPPKGEDDRPDDETMMQVALICSAHF